MAEVKREHRLLALTVFGWDEPERLDHWLQHGGDVTMPANSKCSAVMIDESRTAQAIADAEERGATNALAEVRNMPGMSMVIDTYRTELAWVGRNLSLNPDYRTALVAVLKLLEGG